MVSGICTTRKLLHLICSRLDGFKPSVNLLLLLVHVIKSIICTVCTNYSFQVPFNVIQKLSCQWWNNTCFWLAKTYLSPLICCCMNLCYSVYPICPCPMCCKKSWSRWSAHSGQTYWIMIALLESLLNVLAIPAASPHSPYGPRLTPRRDVHVYTMTSHDIQL